MSLHRVWYHVSSKHQILTENKDSPWPWFCVLRLGGSLIQLSAWAKSGKCWQEQTHPAEIRRLDFVIKVSAVYARSPKMSNVVFVNGQSKHPSIVPHCSDLGIPSGERNLDTMGHRKWNEIQFKMWTWQCSQVALIPTDYGCLYMYLYQGINDIQYVTERGWKTSKQSKITLVVFWSHHWLANI